MTARGELRSGFERLVDDAEAHAARVETCHVVSRAIGQLGQAMWVGGWITRDESAEGLAVLTQIGGELAESTVALLDAEHAYGAAALVRQLVEVEYLAWFFSQDPAEAAAWLRSSPDEIRSLFQPRAMRKRAAGRFRDEEYWSHCDLGGHPNPKARLLLPDHSAQLAEGRWLWIDLAQHLERLWGFLVVAVKGAKWSDALPDGVRADVDAAIGRWHGCDLLAARLPRSVMTDDEPAS